MVGMSTTMLRAEYTPACTPKNDSFRAAYLAIDDAFAHFNYHPRSGVTGGYNCRAITGGTNYSLHAYGPGNRFTFHSGVSITMALAFDVNWDKNPYGPRLVTDMPREMIDAIYRIRTRSGAQVWRWGGYYVNNKDAMHFEIVCSKADLASGIDATTLASQATPQPQPPLGDDDMAPFSFWRFDGDNAVFRVAADGQSKVWIEDPDVLSVDVFILTSNGYPDTTVHVATTPAQRKWLSTIPTVSAKATAAPATPASVADELARRLAT